MKTKMNIASVCGMFLALGLLGGVTPSISKAGHAGSIDHEHDNLGFVDWDSTTTLPTNPGAYYLLENVVLDEPWEVPVGTFDICLNGHTISHVNDDNSFSLRETLIIVSRNSTLNIYDCDNTTIHKFGLSDSSDWIYDDTLEGDDIKNTVTGGFIAGGDCACFDIRGTFNLYGGSIGACCNTAVKIQGGVFNMYDGNICGASTDTGGVTVDYGGSTSGTFNMYGGTIHDNTAYLLAGGVLIIDGTFNMYDGLITNNTSEAFAGGVGIFGGRFNMYDGDITKNTAYFGGGIGVGAFEGAIGDAYIAGGTISENKAVKYVEENGNETIEGYGLGGGIFLYQDSTLIIEGGEIINNVAEISGGGVFAAGLENVDPYYCVAEGTLVTLSDGSTKPVEELVRNERVMVFDHWSGAYKNGCVRHIDKNENVSENVFKLNFEDDISVTCIGGHSFYSKEDSKYVTLTPANAEDYIGKEFYNVDGNWKKLLSVTEINEPVNSYSIFTEYEINFIANGMLSCGDGMYTVMLNVFDFDADLKINQEQLNADIAEYGLLDYSDCQYVNVQTYDYLNLQYLKIAIGKGLITQEQIEAAADFQNANNSGLVLRKKGLYLGGSAVINENKSGTDETIADNLFLWADELMPKINIGTGAKEDGGNGIAVPTDEMNIGITLMNAEGDTHAFTEGAFTYNGEDGQQDYFFSDNEKYHTIFKDNLLQIERAPIVKPIKDTTGFTYDGTEHTYTLEENDAYTITGNKQTNVGTYTVTVALKDKTLDKWEDGSTDDLTFDFTINKGQVAKPSADTTVFTYNGQDQTYALAESDKYTVTGNVKKDAGTYNVKVVLNDKDNYSWSDGTTDDLEYDFVINRAKLDKPFADTGKFVDCGENQTYNISENDFYTVANNTKKDPGNYEVVVSLKDKENLAWDDGSTDDLKYSFVINQKVEDVKVVDENKQEIASPVAEIVEGVNGIKPEAVLVVKVIEVTDNTLIESSKKVLENNNKLSDEEKIYGLYDAKLILDNVEVQPDGMIKIKMLVPEEMQGKDFKVFHIHAGSEVYELEYSLSNDGKYITIVTDKLSQFAFVGEAPKLDICIIHWFLIALLVIGIACFVVFEFVLKKEMYAIISSGACLLISGVLMFFNGCTICTVFTILNAVIFVGMIVYLFIAKNKKESE